MTRSAAPDPAFRQKREVPVRVPVVDDADDRRQAEPAEIERGAAMNQLHQCQSEVRPLEERAEDRMVPIDQEAERVRRLAAGPQRVPEHGGEAEDAVLPDRLRIGRPDDGLAGLDPAEDRLIQIRHDVEQGRMPSRLEDPVAPAVSVSGSGELEQELVAAPE